MSTNGPPTLSLASISVEEEKCMICFDALDLPAIVVPCMHKFDLVCIMKWTQRKGKAAKNCPLCRARISELHHSPDNQNKYQIEIVGEVEASSYSEFEYADSDDEEENSVDSETELLNWRANYAESERVRLSNLGDLRLVYDVTYFDGSLRYLDKIIRIRHHLTLEVQQCDVYTMTELTRTLTVSTDYDIMNWDAAAISSDSSPIIRTYRAALQEQEKHRHSGSNQFGDKDWVVKLIHIENAERNLEIALERTQSLSHTMAAEGKGMNLEFTWTIRMEETGPARHDLDDEGMYLLELQYQVAGPKLEKIRQSTEEIRGIMSFITSFAGQEEGDGSYIIRLDRGRTNLLEKYKGGICYYCGEQHRNGNCIMPQIQPGMILHVSGDAWEDFEYRPRD